MDLRALIINHIDNAAPDGLRTIQQAAVRRLAELLDSHNVAMEILEEPPSPSSHPFPTDIVFILSPMTCWHPGLRPLVDLVRQRCGRAPVIVAETASTLSLRHALESSGADYVHKGDMGPELGFILRTFGYRLTRR